jgi:hypothetical protein
MQYNAIEVIFCLTMVSRTAEEVDAVVVAAAVAVAAEPNASLH